MNNGGLPSRSRATAPVYVLICLGTAFSVVLLGLFTQSTYEATDRLQSLAVLREVLASLGTRLELTDRRHSQQTDALLSTDPHAVIPSGPTIAPGQRTGPLSQSLLPTLGHVAGMQPRLEEMDDLLTRMANLESQAQEWRELYVLTHERLWESREAAMNRSVSIRNNLLSIQGKQRLPVARRTHEEADGRTVARHEMVSTDRLLIELLDTSVALSALLEATDREAVTDITANRLMPILQRLRDTAESQVAESSTDRDFEAASVACEELVLIILGKETANLPGFVSIQDFQTGLISDYARRLESLTHRQQLIRAAAQLADEFDDCRTSITDLADDEASHLRTSINASLFTSIDRCTVAGTIACVIFVCVGWRVAGTIRRYAECVETVTIQVTAAKDRADAALRESEALRSTIDQHSIVSVADASGRIIDANDSLCKISGRTREELLGQDYRILDSGHHPRDFWLEMWNTIAGGRAWRGSICNRSRDGTLYWVDSIIAPFKNADGRTEKYVSICTDITERKRAEATLRYQIEVNDEMGRIAQVGGWDLEVATGKVIWTKEIYRIFELPETFTSTLETSLTLFPEESRRIVAGHVQHAIDTGEPFDYTVPCTTATGRNLWVRGMGKADRRADGVVRVYGAFQDVTKSHLASEELIGARDAAQAASRAKSEFLANMSHEIRTPLTAIMGFADILREDGNISGAPPQRLQAIDSINNAGKHLLTVINDILDLSKIEADKMTVERIDTPLVGILREVESLMRPRAVGKGVTLNALLTSPVPEHILSDPTRLRQILMNLAGNAVKFTESGSVTIAARVDDSHELNRLVIDVEDTGSGMTPEQSSHVFRAFGQADGTVTRKHGGTGLGLTISRRLAGLMGGDVKLLRTEPGKGSCFRLVLPLEPVDGTAMVVQLDAVHETRAPKPPPVTKRLSGRILLVEDGVDNQRLISFHLAKAGASVEVAGNGRIALEMLDRAAAAGWSYSLLLTDMQMPEMDGYTLASTLRQRGSTLAIIALTAHAMADDRHRCMDAGCDDYATKPIDKAALIATCAAWLDRPGGTGMARAAA